MGFMTISHVLMKVLSVALMIRVNRIWFQLVMLGDLLLFFCYKLLRDDLRHWFRVKGALSWIITVFLRTIGKELTDFTLLIQTRHPFECGGMYWSVNLVANQLFCFFSVYLYKKYNNASLEALENLKNTTSSGEDYYDREEIISEALWPLVIGLFLFSMISFACFLLRINRKYLGTFFDTRSGKTFVCDSWRNSKRDEEKFHVFSKHKSYYRSINDELKSWLTENWSRWEFEKEDWFSAKMIRRIPDEVLPDRVLVKLGGAKGRRKSSAVAEEKFQKARLRRSEKDEKDKDWT